jgi:glutamate formiminotransferase
VLECVVNISEGRDRGAIARIGGTAGPALLDVHTDADHHRSVLTLVGPDAARAVGAATVLTLDLRRHRGAHPRIGVLDVVPFVPLAPSTIEDALAARDAFAHWLATTFGVPCFVYGPERSLPEVRRGAFRELAPDVGPPTPHPTAGACAVGARSVLVAYNLWLAEPDIEGARALARSLRGPAVRALGLEVGGEAQVSMNLVDPATVGPADIYDRVAAHAEIDHAELVGLVPRAVLDAVDPARWTELDLSTDRTIEARMAAHGVDGEGG